MPSSVVGARVEVPRKQAMVITPLMRMVRAGLNEEVLGVLGLEGRSGRSGLPPLPPVCVPAGV